MNILFLTVTKLHNVEERGIYSDLMRKFAANGHKVYVVSPFERRMNRKTELFNSVGVNILGVKTLNIQKAKFVEKGIGTLLLEYQYARAVRKYLKDIKFDMVLYSTPPITLNKVIRYVKQRFNARSYLLLKDIFPQNAVDLRMFSERSILYRWFRRKERQLYMLSDKIGCMSPENVDYLLKHNPDIDPQNVHVNPNSIELTIPTTEIEKTATRIKYGIPTDRMVFIYGGNLGKPQGIDFLLQVLEFYRNNDNLFFVIAGSGTEYDRVHNWFANHNPDNAVLLSHIPKPEYDMLVGSCDVGLIFLDKRFTIPNYPSRLLSYLEYRMPIIVASDKSTDIGRIAEQNGYGFWSESGDIDAFDKNIQKILDRHQTIVEMGETGYQFLMDNYTVDKTYSIIVNSVL